MVRTVLAASLLIGFAAPVAAGPISVFTQVREVGGSGSDELRLSGLGDFAVLTTGGGVNPVVTVPADQTGASQAGVVGFWPVLGFRDRAQYEAQRGTVLTIPDTPVTLYAEIWNGAYGGTQDVRIALINAVISGTFGAGPGQNALDWKFVDPPTQIDFGQTTVTLSYTPVTMPDGVPQIQFADGSPLVGTPGSPYYPTLLTAHVAVQRSPDDPGTPTDPPGTGEPGSPVGTPEPSTALLLAGLSLGGFAARARAMRKG